MTSDPRNAHPYHMHEAILAQPEAFVRVVERNEAEVEEFASLMTSCKRIFLAGVGTSHHATLVGEHLMRAYGGGPDVRAPCTPSTSPSTDRNSGPMTASSP
jgi:glutamine---fructose-6-phosphate transaminase (isomerizing)